MLYHHVGPSGSLLSTPALTDDAGTATGRPTGSRSARTVWAAWWPQARGGICRPRRPARGSSRSRAATLGGPSATSYHRRHGHHAQVPLSPGLPSCPKPRSARHDLGGCAIPHRTPRDVRRRALGQNFLHDQSVVADVIGTLHPPPGSLVVDLGAGAGALTSAAAARRARVIAVELDPDWTRVLRTRGPSWGDFVVAGGSRCVCTRPSASTSSRARRTRSGPSSCGAC